MVEGGWCPFFVGLAKHDSHRIKTVAGNIGNALACTDENGRAGCAISRVICAKALATSSGPSERRPQQCLGKQRGTRNLALSSEMICFEHEVDACGDHSVYRARSPSGESQLSWEDAAAWSMEICFQSGGLASFVMEGLVLKFTDLPIDSARARPPKRTKGYLDRARRGC